MTANLTSSPNPGPYAGWTRERLIERLTQLEETATAPSDAPRTALSTSHSNPGPTKAPEKPFDFSKHARRKIALKFCYSGWEYGGLAFQIGPTPLPTVENVLFDVLAKTRLVDEEAGFDGCGWEKCGRTDRGVSAAGQVVSLWVRSALPAEKKETREAGHSDKATKEAGTKEGNDSSPDLADDLQSLALSDEPATNSSLKQNPKPRQEHDYIALLNRLLPDTIRVIAWSPVSDSFSARFSCKYRHYKYFFSSLNLDVALMQAAADRMIGEHDFRNLCKVDAQKQITSFRRVILRASVSPVEGDDAGNMHVFDLVGSAFLYHQVRHIMAVLFLVGSGLEPPSVVTELMNVDKDVEHLRTDDEGRQYSVVDRKPEYQMADALPLMLWDCGYDESELDWRISGNPKEIEPTQRADLHHQVQGIHTRSRVFAALDAHFLKAVEKHHPPPAPLFPMKNGPKDLQTLNLKKKGQTGRETLMNIPLGGGTFKRSLKYVPLLERKRLDTVDVINERWRVGKGMRRDERQKAVVQEDGDE